MSKESGEIFLPSIGRSPMSVKMQYNFSTRKASEATTRETMNVAMETSETFLIDLPHISNTNLKLRPASTDKKDTLEEKRRKYRKVSATTLEINGMTIKGG